MNDANLNKIVLEKQSDGNWIGKANKFGVDIEVREVKPEDCLTKILTHDGQTH